MTVVDLPWKDRALVLSGDDEPLHWFTSVELEIADAFRLAKRRQEWLLSRVAAKQLALSLGLCTDPRDCVVDRPFLRLAGQRSDWRVSVSHSWPFAGAVISRIPAGIDVQVPRDLSEAASHLFLTDEETETMQTCTIEHRLIHFWCAKEAAWKQRSHELATLKQCPIRLQDQTTTGLTFDVVETTAAPGLIVAVTT